MCQPELESRETRVVQVATTATLANYRTGLLGRGNNLECNPIDGRGRSPRAPDVDPSPGEIIDERSRIRLRREITTDCDTRGKCYQIVRDDVLSLIPPGVRFHQIIATNIGSYAQKPFALTSFRAP